MQKGRQRGERAASWRRREVRTPAIRQLWVAAGSGMLEGVLTNGNGSAVGITPCRPPGYPYYVPASKPAARYQQPWLYLMLIGWLAQRAVHAEAASVRTCSQQQCAAHDRNAPFYLQLIDIKRSIRWMHCSCACSKLGVLPTADEHIADQPGGAGGRWYVHARKLIVLPAYLVAYIRVLNHGHHG